MEREPVGRYPAVKHRVTDNRTSYQLEHLAQLEQSSLYRYLITITARPSLKQKGKRSLLPFNVLLDREIKRSRHQFDTRVNFTAALPCFVKVAVLPSELISKVTDLSALSDKPAQALVSKIKLVIFNALLAPS